MFYKIILSNNNTKGWAADFGFFFRVHNVKKKKKEMLTKIFMY